METRTANPDPDNEDGSTAGYTLGGAQGASSPAANLDIQLETVIDEDFQVSGIVGPGGCGMVYKARQISIPREVVLKVIKSGLSVQAVIERFKLEKATLGSLNHPNIVNVISSGNHNGQPYFAMEYVDGQHITKYTDKRNLPVNKRLELFLQVCDAIDYAHERGVIHRDLKPANILVTEKVNGEPLVKVIDFGIAKVVNNGLPLAYATQTGQPIGTPAYMSPEQTGEVAGSVSESSDIYSLGVVLYELLVGKLPLEIIGSQDDQLKMIRETPVLPPSSRINEKDDVTYFQVAHKRGVDPAELDEIVRGELDRIVMKCLEKECQKRFASVEELKVSIQNYLAANQNNSSTRLGINKIPADIALTNQNQKFNCVPVFEKWKEPSYRGFGLVAMFMVFVGIPVMGLVCSLFLGPTLGFAMPIFLIPIILLFFFLDLLYKRRFNYKICQKCPVCDFVSSSWPPEILTQNWKRAQLVNHKGWLEDCSLEDYLERFDERGKCSKCGAVEGKAFKPA